MGRDVFGGQAVLEGVLMFGRGKYAVAVRGTNGVSVQKGALPRLSARLLSIPLFRGLAVLYLTFFVSVKAMHFSTNQVLEDDEVGWGLVAAVVLASLVAMAFLLTVAPFFIADLLITTESSAWFSLVEGMMRIVLFVLYVLAISILADVRRMYGYHGAEHKVVNSYEHTGKLSLAQARTASTLNPRCSTSFVVLVLAVAILAFALVPADLPWLLSVMVRLVLVVPIVAVGFELVTLTAKYASSWWVQPLVWPGYVVQKMTTREPDEDMLCVALTAARAIR